jgi:hypothetical protein
MHAFLLVLALQGCSGDDSPPPKPVETAPPVVERSDLEKARDAYLAGNAAEAAKLAESFLATHPDNDSVWDLLERSALRAGEAGALVDRLSADKAIGDRVERHHALRGSLALVANRPADALAAARALASVAPGDAAALVAGAVKLGAPTPEGVDPTTSLLLAAIADPKTEIDPAVGALPGWRIALVRAELMLSRGDKAGAAAELAQVPAGLPRLAALPVALAAAADAPSAWKLSEAAAREAVADNDAFGAAAALDQGVPFALATWNADAAATVAKELRAKATEAGSTEGAAALAAVEAHALLRAGQIGPAKEAAVLAAASTGTKVRGSWELALACAAHGDAAGVAATAAALAEPEATAARELAAALHGADRTPGLALDPERAALVALLASGWLDDPREAYDAGAKAAAPDLRMWAATRADRAALDGAEGTNLAAESTIRTFVSTGKGAAITSDHPDAASWNAVVAGEAGQPGAGLAAWARARTALKAADVTGAAREYAAMSSALPGWRTGPWASPLLLDGPSPEQLGTDAEWIRAAADAVTPAAEMHGWAHRREEARLLWHAGVAPLPATATPEQVAAVWQAHAAYRVAALKWLAQGGAFPTAARAALTTTEQAAGLTATQSPSAVALRGALDASAIISFRRLPGMVEVLYLTATGGKLVKVRPQSVEAMAAWTRSVGAGDTSVQAGDRLRTALIDSASDVLTGTGKFLVVGPPPFGSFAIASLPEQADGLRFLADIRSVSYYPDFDTILAPENKPPEEFGQTLVAITAGPVESENIKRLFPQAMVLEGPAATVAGWKTNAGTARFVHLGDLPMGPTGGWQLADGELTLADVALTPLQARGGYIGGGGDPLGAQARLAALRKAGLNDFLVGAPATDPAFHERLVAHFWAGVNRRYSATRSYNDARGATMKEFELGNRPSNWVRYLVAGKP